MSGGGGPHPGWASPTPNHYELRADRAIRAALVPDVVRNEGTGNEE